MKKTPIKRVGRVGKANIKANKLIRAQAQGLGLSFCEINFKECLRTFPLAPAHRHKRHWYKGQAEKLADIRQWVIACQYCHDKIEHNTKLTEEVFKALRGPEDDTIDTDIVYETCSD